MEREVIGGNTTVDGMLYENVELTVYGSLTNCTLNAAFTKGVQTAGGDIVTAKFYLGATASGTTMSGGIMEFYEGTYATGTTIWGGGSQSIYNNASSVDNIINDDARIYVYNGGLVGKTTMWDRSEMYIYSGGVASGAEVTEDAAQYVQYGGAAYDTIMVNGGRQYVEKGGAAFGTNILYDTVMVLNGEASGTTISDRGQLAVEATGEAYNTVLNRGGQVNNFKQYMFAADGSAQEAAYIEYISGGKILGGVSGLNFYGELTIGSQSQVVNGATLYSFGYGVDNIIGSNGVMNTEADTAVSGTVVSSAGKLNLGGSAEATTVYGGGVVKVLAGGVAYDTSLEDGALLTVVNGGRADGLQVNKGADAVFEAGAVLGGRLSLAGNITFAAGVVADELEVAFGIYQRDAADGYIVSNLDVAGADSYTVLVGAQQAVGDYKLAQGAYSLSADDAVSVEMALTEAVLGSVTVNNSLRSDGYIYSLSNDGGNLSMGVVKANKTLDFNANGVADVFMVHEAGFTGAWLVNENQSKSWGDLSNVSGDWKVFGTGNIDGNEYTDVVLYNEVTNSVGAWTVGKDGKVTGWTGVAELGSDKKAIGLGDFDGDGKSEVLCASGANSSDVTVVDTNGSSASLGTLNGWSVSAVGDVNGDGIDDLVIRDSVNGYSGVWMIGGDGKVTWGDLQTLNSDQQIAGCGDFNGDGIEDVLVSNSTNGAVGAWLMDNEGKITSWMDLGTLNEGVSIEEIGDFNNDGIDDLRVRTEAGDLGALLVDSTGSLTWNYYGSVGDEWSTSFYSTLA